MFGISATLRVFVAVSPTDLRNGYDGLARLAREVINQDPLSGHLFVFSNRKHDRVKVLYWDRDGYVVWMKRLEKGTFRWPKVGEKQVEWNGVELTTVLGGIDLNQTKRRPRYSLESQ